MNYEVNWAPVAEQIGEILDNAPDKAAMFRAAERLDAALGYCPARASESRGAAERIAVELPLVATFEIDEDDQRVNVLRLRYRERPDFG